MAENKEKEAARKFGRPLLVSVDCFRKGRCRTRIPVVWIIKNTPAPPVNTSIGGTGSILINTNFTNSTKTDIWFLYYKKTKCNFRVTHKLFGFASRVQAVMQSHRNGYWIQCIYLRSSTCGVLASVFIHRALPKIVFLPVINNVFSLAL